MMMGFNGNTIVIRASMQTIGNGNPVSFRASQGGQSARSSPTFSISGRHLAYVSPRMLGRLGLADDADAFFRDLGLGPDALNPAVDQRAFVALFQGR